MYLDKESYMNWGNFLWDWQFFVIISILGIIKYIYFTEAWRISKMLGNDTEYINLIILLCLAIFSLCYIEEAVVNYKDMLSWLYLNRVADFLIKWPEINNNNLWPF